MSHPALARLGVLLWVAGVAWSCEREQIASAEVVERPFVHRVRADGNLVAVQSTPITVPSQVRRRARVAWLAEDGSRVSEGDVVLRFDARDMERNLINARGDLDKSRHERVKSSAEATAQMKSLEKNREMADLELDVSERFQTVDETLYSRHEIIESRIDGDLARERKDHAVEVGEIRTQLNATDAALVDISRRLAERRIEEAQEGLAALEVRAPHAGLLTWTRDWTGEPIKVGAEVWSGRTLGTLPSLDQMQAQVYVLEADAGGIEAGQRATFSVDSRPERLIEARVVSVGAVSQPRFRGSPVRFFEVTLEPEATDAALMKPGQRVSAFIYLEDRESALVVPRAALHRDGRQDYVYRRNGDSYQRREVTVGAQSIALAVIEDGLESGDRIALEDPSVAIASAMSTSAQSPDPAAGVQSADR